MRTTLINFNRQNIEQDLNLDKTYKKCMFFDVTDDVDEADYCISMRLYDLFFLNIDEKLLNNKKYLNILRTLHNQYKQYTLYITYDESIKESLLTNLKNKIKKSYSSVDENTQYINKTNLNIEDFIKEETTNHFLSIPLKEISSINYEERIITIMTEEDKEVELVIKKNLDFQVVLYFIRHYTEVINIDAILSGIAQEPEFINNSPIESSISSIRKIFKKSLQVNPIKAFKRIGYQLTLQNKIAI